MLSNNKLIERKCLEKTIAFASSATKTTRNILSLFDGRIDETERPDFLITNKNDIIGVEHFLVDTLLGKKKKAQSRSRQSEIIRTYEKYRYNFVDKKKEALSAVGKLVQEEIDVLQYFDYKKFIEEYKRIFSEHASRVNEYKALNKIQKMVFLIEITISKYPILGLNMVTNEWEPIKGRRFPLTVEMLNTIEEYSKSIDYFVISIMHENYKKYPYMVYAFDSTKLKESILSEIKDLYLEFTYDWEKRPVKTKVDLRLSDSDE